MKYCTIISKGREIRTPLHDKQPDTKTDRAKGTQTETHTHRYTRRDKYTDIL